MYFETLQYFFFNTTSTQFKQTKKKNINFNNSSREAGEER